MDIKRMIDNQARIFDLLKKNKQNNRLSHAYLFYGDDGVGKKEMAYALACLFYCEHGGCLECETCNTILEGKHLNVNYIGTLESKKLISKDQITALQEEFSKTSLVEGYRIYIVDGIDTASVAAQNSLLKFIEEPINNTPTIGIFIANEIANVVSTIVSRCALISFPSIDIDKKAKELEEQGVEPLDAILASIITNSPSEQTISDVNFTNAKDLFLEFLNLKNNKEAVLFYLNKALNLTFDTLRIFFKWLIVFYEDLFKIDSKDSLILKPLYDKIIVYMKKDYNQNKKQYSIVLELYSKLDYNISYKNVFHELITKMF